VNCGAVKKIFGSQKRMTCCFLCVPSVCCCCFVSRLSVESHRSVYSLATTKHPTQHTHLMQRSRRPPGRSPSLSRRRLTSIAMLSFTLVCFLCISCFCSSASASPSPSSSSIVPPLSRWSVSSVVSSDDECVVSGSHNLTFGLLISGW
jgi:hypothetical protein